MTRAILLVLLVVWGTSADAQQACAPRTGVVYRLANQYLEQPAWASDPMDDGTVDELWINPATGTWTRLNTRPDGVTCLSASGRGFNLLPFMDPPVEDVPS